MSTSFADQLGDNYPVIVADIEAFLKGQPDYKEQNIPLFPDGTQWGGEGRIPFRVQYYSKADLVQQMRDKTKMGRMWVHQFLALYQKYVVEPEVRIRIKE